MADLIHAGGNIRAVGILDSRVTLCSTIKGRSPFAAIRAQLSHRMPLQIGGGLYPSFTLAPPGTTPRTLRLATGRTTSPAARRHPGFVTVRPSSMPRRGSFWDCPRSAGPGPNGYG